MAGDRWKWPPDPTDERRWQPEGSSYTEVALVVALVVIVALAALPDIQRILGW